MRVTRAIPGLVCICLLAQEPIIRTNVPLVLVPVTVTDSKGAFIDGLQPEDFLLYDDKALQKNVRMDTSDTVLAPVSMVIAIQASGISTPALEKIHRVGSLIQPLVAGDRGQAAVIAFDEEIRPLQDFTRDADKITGAFQVVQPRTIKTAHLLDAIAQGIGMLGSRPENYRRVMLILSESRDRGSRTRLDKAIEMAQRASVAIYPVTYSAQKTSWTVKPEDNPEPTGTDYLGGIVELGRLATTNAAQKLADSTGGRHLSFARVQGLEQAISRVGEEIHSQYLLSFAPVSSDNRGYHRISVSVRGRPDAIVRARPGYWAEK